jgi:hypothetical protein
LSGRFQLNKNDLSLWGRNALIFAGPALIVLAASFKDIIPKEAEWGAMALFALNLITDLIRKFIADNSAQ